MLKAHEIFVDHISYCNFYSVNFFFSSFLEGNTRMIFSFAAAHTESSEFPDDLNSQG